MRWTLVMLIVVRTFEGILSKTALCLAKHMQKTRGHIHKTS